MEEKTPGKVIVVGMMILVIGIGVAAAAYKHERGETIKRAELARLMRPTETPKVENEINQFPSPTGRVRDIIFIEGEGAMPGEIRKDLQVKVIDPIVKYYSNETVGKLNGLRIINNLNPSNENYPYLGEIVLDDGSITSFVIENTRQGIIEWVPVVMESE